MRIHKEGYLIILIFGLLIGALDFGFCLITKSIPILYIIFISISIIFYFFVIRFFRHPIRKINNTDDNKIYCPADGKIVVIEEITENEYFKDNRIQVSVFMSPLDIHVNWYSIGGIIKYFKYHPGAHLVAYDPKSSIENEHTTIVIENSQKKEILLKQIAGKVARRIIYYAKKDIKINQGDELGFIKFGSRVDIILPLNAKILVNLEQKVKGNLTIIAEI
ncbi:MAG: phosphatidylserine decarboxylase family protein [Bacteroidetes bacterium]|nr:MAG: phosphatidylserine decarboxylase family protein [Bacteroidota bacterium]